MHILIGQEIYNFHPITLSNMSTYTYALALSLIYIGSMLLVGMYINNQALDIML